MPGPQGLPHTSLPPPEDTVQSNPAHSSSEEAPGCRASATQDLREVVHFQDPGAPGERQEPAMQGR